MYLTLIFLTLLLITFELKVDSFKNSLFTFSKRSKRNFFYLMSSIITILAVNFMGQYLRPICRGFLVIDSLALNLTMTFLIAELLNYLFHYFKHFNTYLWKFHFQHHIENKYNLWLVCHTQSLEVFISGSIISVILICLGASTEAVQVYLLFYSLVNTYQHSARNYSLGVLDYLIVGPRYHRLHHLKGSTTNYGSTLTIWDIVFKTATWPKKDHFNNGFGINNEKLFPFDFKKEFFYFLKSNKTDSIVVEKPSY